MIGRTARRSSRCSCWPRRCSSARGGSGPRRRSGLPRAGARRVVARAVGELPRDAPARGRGTRRDGARSSTTTARCRTSSRRSEEDAYRALGYVVARDRLFQLYAADARRERAAHRDRRRHARCRSTARCADSGCRARPSGLAALGDTSTPSVASRAPTPTASTRTSRRCRRASCRSSSGCSASRPPQWKPVDTYHLFNRMGWTLAYIANERRSRRRPRRGSGCAAADALFPDDSPIQEPIQPNGQRAPRFDFHPLPPPGAPDSASLRVAAAADAFVPSRAARARGRTSDAAMRWRATTGRSRRGARRPDTRCSPAIRISISRCPRSGTRRISSCPARSTCTA